MNRNLRSFNQKQEFIRDAMPGSWLEYADELRDAAEILWQKTETNLRVDAEIDYKGRALNLLRGPSISRPYVLLSAFAIENLLKGLLVAQNPNHINSGKLSDDIWGHDIIGLASKIRGLKLSAEEKEFCHIAKAALPYWGRYPVPKEFKSIKKQVLINEELREIFLKLHHRLRRKVYDMIKDGWNSGAGPEIIEVKDVRYGDVINIKKPFRLKR